MKAPNIKAKRGVACPSGTGRFMVLRMCGSMSASYHMLMAFEPPAERVPPATVMSMTQSVCPQVRSTSRTPFRAKVSCTKIAQSAVI